MIYSIVQSTMAIITSVLLLNIMAGFPGYDLAANGLGQNGYGAASPTGFSLASGFIAEVVLTFIS